MEGAGGQFADHKLHAEMLQNEYWFYDDPSRNPYHDNPYVATVFLTECVMQDGKLNCRHPGYDGRSYNGGTITYEGGKTNIKWPNGVSFSDPSGPAPTTTTTTAAPSWNKLNTVTVNQGNALKTLDPITADDCKLACEADGACLSITYSPGKTRCHLKDHCASPDEPMQSRSDDYVMYYMPCMRKSSIPNATMTIAFGMV
jgi:hypothetical protein